jgi:hypothetical protein
LGGLSYAIIESAGVDRQPLISPPIAEAVFTADRPGLGRGLSLHE